MPFTARIERAPSERARSMSTGDHLSAFSLRHFSLRTRPLAGGMGRSLTARIEGAHSDRARSASEGDLRSARAFPPLTALSTGSYNPLMLLPVTD